jgi:hypothetical protein
MLEEPTYRIVSGGPREVEREVNQLSEDYAPLMWNVQPGSDGPLVTCVMVSAREMRKAALAQARMTMPVRAQ